MTMFGTVDATSGTNGPRRPKRRVLVVARAWTLTALAGLAGVGGVGGLGGLGVGPEARVMAQAAVAEPAAVVNAGELAQNVWSKARAGDEPALLRVLDTVPAEGAGPGWAALRSNVDSLEANLAKRDKTRADKLAEAETKFAEELAKETTKGLSNAVRHAVAMHELSQDKAAFKAEARIADVIKRAEAAARTAEAAGDWFTANELYFRLNALMEEEGTYRDDLRRLGLRLTMLRLYVPEQFWKLRNDERVDAGKSPLPPYNGLGEDWRDKIKGINRTMVMRAMLAAAQRHIDARTITLTDLTVGGLESLKTLITTGDLKKAFPSLEEGAARDAMVNAIDQKIAGLRMRNAPIPPGDLPEMFEELVRTSATTVKIPENVILHEFGNGAMSRLDDFSAIIWPDEVARFDRMTQGNFIGVGIQIQIDDESQMIKVVSPIEGTPAQRAGVRAGDLIKKINGESAVGISLNQAVDLITGPANTPVTVTMERPATDADAKAQELDFEMKRSRIPLHTVKGWRRTGVRETDWDWFIDRENRVGYIRLTQFTEDTTTDLHRAVAQMKSDGPVRGLIVDLRFNPGGLLTEAVSVANTFITNGPIVSTEGTIPGETRGASPEGAVAGTIPLIVLVNEGSASASEIVSGAVRHYADKNEIPALVLGQRSFGKGSVQNVWPISDASSPPAKMKLTTQYYFLPDRKLIHRKPGAKEWGVDPHLLVHDLPDNQSEALRLRQDADVLPVDERGQVVESKTPRPDPQKILDDGLDLQLQHALAILQARALASAPQPVDQAHLPAPRTTPQPQ